MSFNEDTRVKIPAILHLCKLGYEYLSLKETKWNIETNIFEDIFIESVMQINPDIEEDDVKRFLQELNLDLGNEDLGKAFYEKLLSKSGIKIIDFEDFENNKFNVVTELTYKNEDEEFRPDITVLINGMPLAFIEVKKPNNREGILAERERINRRFGNKKFRKFVNITQLMVFSNNMEYDDGDIDPLQGAYYATTSYKKPIFNYFRDEEAIVLNEILTPEYEEMEDYILKDNNYTAIKYNAEFITNKESGTPTNRILTSLFRYERLAYILEYAFAYVKTETKIEKHIMRYPQFFAARAIRNTLEQGKRKGIIWHTQGSGKTALSYYCVKYLTDYFQGINIIPKFYFIVDRISLLKQAKKEFTSRGLSVHAVNSREDFVADIKKTTVLHNESGNAEITVINIQKFSEDSQVAKATDYNLNIQRIYFLDEVHRSYNPKGSFLANLFDSDTNSIKIGLTGTPLIGLTGEQIIGSDGNPSGRKDNYSKLIFGDYIHKYYYNASIADGYTLRLIREEISAGYKIELNNLLEKIRIAKGEIKPGEALAHPIFVEPLLGYIISDMEHSRLMYGDETIGGMVVCDTANQARMMYEIFMGKYTEESREKTDAERGIERESSYIKKKCEVTKSALILYDSGSKEEREDWVTDFKTGKIDILFVYNMLLTGFDAPRLKKMYLGRTIKSHNLLQALTRVNRTYKNHRYGYVVDFVNIKPQFDITNQEYLKELHSELGDEMENYSNLFKSKEEMEAEIEEIKQLLFSYNTENAEEYSRQISKIEDKKKILDLKKVLLNAKELYNIIRLLGHYELLELLDFHKLNDLYKETVNRLTLLSAKDALENSQDSTNILNIAIEDVIFEFIKIGEEELRIADELRNNLSRTRVALQHNFDKKDGEFITLYEELKRIFKNKKLDEVTQDEMSSNIVILDRIYARINELNRLNELLRSKYDGDAKFARIHKRISEKGELSKNKQKIVEALKAIKATADESVLKNSRLLENEDYFNSQMMRLVINQLKNRSKFSVDTESLRYINNLVVKEYIDEFNGRTYYGSTI